MVIDAPGGEAFRANDGAAREIAIVAAEVARTPRREIGMIGSAILKTPVLAIDRCAPCPRRLQTHGWNMVFELFRLLPGPRFLAGCWKRQEYLGEKKFAGTALALCNAFPEREDCVR